MDVRLCRRGGGFHAWLRDAAVCAPPHCTFSVPLHLGQGGVAGAGRGSAWGAVGSGTAARGRWRGRIGGICLLLFPACLHGRSSRPHSQAETPLIGKPGLFRPAVMLWCARQESNLNLRLRRPPFYPLNYGRAVYPESTMIRMRSGERQVVSMRQQALFSAWCWLLKLTGSAMRRSVCCKP